jgi:hypothetical protein
MPSSVRSSTYIGSVLHSTQANKRVALSI